MKSHILNTACGNVKNLWLVGNARHETKGQRRSEDEDSGPSKILNSVKKQVYLLC